MYTHQPNAPRWIQARLLVGQGSYRWLALILTECGSPLWFEKITNITECIVLMIIWTYFKRPMIWVENRTMAQLPIQCHPGLCGELRLMIFICTMFLDASLRRINDLSCVSDATRIEMQISFILIGVTNRIPYGFRIKIRHFTVLVCYIRHYSRKICSLGLKRTRKVILGIFWTVSVHPFTHTDFGATSIEIWISQSLNY